MEAYNASTVKKGKNNNLHYLIAVAKDDVLAINKDYISFSTLLLARCSFYKHLSFILVDVR